MYLPFLFIIFLLMYLRNCGSNDTSDGQNFQDLNYKMLKESISSLISPQFSSIVDAKSLYNIGPSKDGTIKCSPQLIRVSDMESLKFDVTRPQLIISGEIHGDERVGPLSSLLTARLLIWSANCVISKNLESCQQLDAMGGISLAQRYWLAFLATRRDTYIIPAANCLGHILSKRDDAGIDPNRDFPYSRSTNKCIQSNTAKIFMALMSFNMVQLVVTFHGGMVALGYEWGSKNHMAPNDASPDDAANSDIALAMKNFGGAFHNEKHYSVGRINSMVYPVEGGMEDWLYAAGWDHTAGILRNCSRSGTAAEPDWTQLRPENRALVFLAETSNAKNPPMVSLGGSYQILDPKSKQSGHIPRNVRLSLMAIDLVEPYVCLSHLSVVESPFNSRRSKFRKRSMMKGEDAHRRQLVSEGSSESKGQAVSAGRALQLQWYVGGATSVDRTFLFWHRPVEGLHNHWHTVRASLLTPSMETLFDQLFASSDTTQIESITRHYRSMHHQQDMFPFPASLSQSGKSRWHFPSNAVDPHTWNSSQTSWPSDAEYSTTDPLQPKSHFSAIIHPSFRIFSNSSKESSMTAKVINMLTDNIAVGMKSFPVGKYWLIAWTMVDQHYGERGQGYPRDMHPQSHLVNARTNSSWCKRPVDIAPKNIKSDRMVQGRRYWPSIPIEIDVTNTGSFRISKVHLHCIWWKS